MATMNEIIKKARQGRITVGNPRITGVRVTGAEMVGGYPQNPYGGAAIVPEQYGQPEGSILAMPQTAVGAGLAVTITLNSVPNTFKPDRLVLEDAVAGGTVGLSVTGLAIGSRNLLENTNNIPGSFFGHDSTLRPLKFVTAQQGQPISLTVANATAAAITVNAALSGTRVQPV